MFSLVLSISGSQAIISGYVGSEAESMQGEQQEREKGHTGDARGFLADL